VMNMEEIRANIRELMQGFVTAESEVEIATMSPHEVEVHLNGKHFNTYLVKEKKFKHNIVREPEENSAFNIDVLIIQPKIYEEYNQYQGAQLRLPASEYEIKDALLRARVSADTKGYEIKECILYDKDIMSQYLLHDEDNPVTIEKINYLARIMNRFDRHEHELFKGYMAMKGSFVLSIKDLINIAYNLHCCELIYDIDSDEMLGRYFADNGMLEWLGDAHELIWKFLDYRKIGEEMRRSDNGIYTESGYFVFNDKEYSEIYDGKNFPETFIDDGYIFKLLIAKKNTQDHNDGKWLSLPASKEGKQNFLREIGADSFDDCVLFALQSMETNFPMCVTGLSQIGLLNSLAHRMRDMAKSNELAKYMAVLEGFGFETVEEAVSYANRLGDYELYSKPSTVIEYAKDFVKSAYGGAVPDAMYRHLNFATYAEDLIAEQELALSEYGVVRHNEKKEIRRADI